MIKIDDCCLFEAGTCKASKVEKTFNPVCMDNPNCCFRRKEHWKEKYYALQKETNNSR